MRKACAGLGAHAALDNDLLICLCVVFHRHQQADKVLSASAICVHSTQLDRVLGAGVVCGIRCVGAAVLSHALGVEPIGPEVAWFIVSHCGIITQPVAHKARLVLNKIILEHIAREFLPRLQQWRMPRTLLCVYSRRGPHQNRVCQARHGRVACRVGIPACLQVV